MIVRLSNLSTRAPQRSDLKAVVELMAICDVTEAMRQEDLEEEVRGAWQSDTFHLESDAWIIVNSRAQVVGYTDVRQESEGRFMATIYVHPV